MEGMEGVVPAPPAAPQAIAHHVKIAQIEDPERERPSGKENRVEGKMGDPVASLSIAVSACDPPVGGAREACPRPGAVRRARCSDRRQAP